MRLSTDRVLLLVLAAAVVLNLLARTSADPWLALASAALLVLPVVSLVLRPRLRDLAVEQRQLAPVAVGEQVEVLVRVRNTGRRWTPPARWQQRHPGLSPAELDVPALAPGQVHEQVLSRTATARGVYQGRVRRELTTLSTTAPFGVLRWTAPAEAAGLLVVHPVTTRAAVREAGLSLALTSRSVPVAGAGTEVLGLRHWRPGDALRDVSSRATARHGRPVVLQRERDAGPSLVVVAEGGGEGPGWEQAVSAAASLALAALVDGRPPMLVAAPAPSRVDALGLLDFFAGVDGTGPLSDGQVTSALRRVGRGGTVALLAGSEERGRHLQQLARAAGCRVEVLRG